MDIEREILGKVGRILLISTLVVTVAATAWVFGAKQWFWRQVDQEVAYQADRLQHTAFGDIISRPEVRLVNVWRYYATIDIVVVHTVADVKTVFLNVSARGEDASAHSLRARVTTTNGIDTAWSAWTRQ
jgi:hypothetical protein